MTIAEKKGLDKAWRETLLGRLRSRIGRFWPVPRLWLAGAAGVLASAGSFGLGIAYAREEAAGAGKDDSFWIEQLPAAERDASLVLPPPPAAKTAAPAGKRTTSTRSKDPAASSAHPVSVMPPAPSVPAAPPAATATLLESPPAAPLPIRQEPAPAPAPAPPAVPAMPAGGEVVASKNGTAYYLPWCTGAKRINPENLVTFPSAADAEANGYKPAKNCKGI